MCGKPTSAAGTENTSSIGGPSVNPSLPAKTLIQANVVLKIDVLVVKWIEKHVCDYHQGRTQYFLKGEQAFSHKVASRVREISLT